MSIAAADLVPYFAGSLIRVENDTAVVGGGVDVGSAFVLADPGANSGLELVSSQADDTFSVVKVRAWKDIGILQTSNNITLTGATAVGVTFPSGGGTCIRVATFTVVTQYDASGTATITLRLSGAGATQAQVVSTTDFYATRAFIAAFATTAGITRYDKTFWKNKHATLTAISPTYRLTADPKARIRQGIHTSKNDTVTIANRVTAPGGITFVDDNIDQVGSDLAPADAQGIWWEFASTPNDPAAPFQDSFTSQITVTTV